MYIYRCRSCARIYHRLSHLALIWIYIVSRHRQTSIKHPPHTSIPAQSLETPSKPLNNHPRTPLAFRDRPDPLSLLLPYLDRAALGPRSIGTVTTTPPPYFNSSRPSILSLIDAFSTSPLASVPFHPNIKRLLSLPQHLHISPFLGPSFVRSHHAPPFTLYAQLNPGTAIRRVRQPLYPSPQL